MKFLFYHTALLVIIISGCGEDLSTTVLPQNPVTPRCINSPLTSDLAEQNQEPVWGQNNKPIVADVIQAGFNVCYFYAFLSSYVEHHPQDIKNSIKKVAQGYEVETSNNNQQCIFISNQQLGTFRQKGRSQSLVLWPEILTAAWVSHLNKGEMAMAVDEEVKKTGSNRALGSSLLLQGKTINIDLVMKDPFKFFMNKQGRVRRIKPKDGIVNSDYLADADGLLNFIGSCLDAGCVMYAYVAPRGSSHGKTLANGLANGLYDHHCYGILGVDRLKKQIILRNPHGGSKARSVSYAPDLITMRPGIQKNERFFMRASDFYNEFYTLQFSDF